MFLTEEADQLRPSSWRSLAHALQLGRDLPQTEVRIGQGDARDQRLQPLGRRASGRAGKQFLICHPFTARHLALFSRSAVQDWPRSVSTSATSSPSVKRPHPPDDGKPDVRGSDEAIEIGLVS